MRSNIFESNKVEPPVVLCVSNDKSYVNEIRQSLGRAGFSVLTTPSPADAIDMAIESDLDAVLCEYNLTNMDGITFYKNLVSVLGENTPPTLIMDKTYSKAIFSECLKAETAGLYIKTETIEKLIDRITSIIQNDIKRSLLLRSSSHMQFKGGADPLTNVASQDHFLRRMKGESIAAYGNQSAISLLFLAVDEYSSFRKRFGRDKSEGALVQIARLVEGELRSRDCVARYSEYTFAIILPDTPATAASAVGHRLLHRLSSSQFGDLDTPISLTVSIGVSTRSPGTKATEDELISQALKNCKAARMMNGNKLVADNTLTGRPLILLLSKDKDLAFVVANHLRDTGAEVRLSLKTPEAEKILLDIPVAMIISYVNSKSDINLLDTLLVARSNFPSIRRLLLAGHLDMDLVKKAVNKASIHKFVSMSDPHEILKKVVSDMLFG